HHVASHVVLAQLLELERHALPDAKLFLLTGERRLDSRPFGQVDLADAVAAEVLHVRRAEEREMHEREAAERPFRRQRTVLGILGKTAGADRAAREEMLATGPATRAEQRRGGRAGFGNREVTGAYRDAGPCLGGHCPPSGRD